MATDNIFAGSITCAGFTNTGTTDSTGAVVTDTGFIGPSISSQSVGVPAPGAAGTGLVVTAENGTATLIGTGGAGGSTTVYAGNGGNGTTGGAGGTLLLEAGNAGTGGNANGGSILLLTGSNTGSGVVGAVYVESVGASPAPFVQNMSIQALADSSETVTVASVRSGVWTVAVGGFDRTKTLPSAANIVAGFPGITVGSVISIAICNLKAANTVTLAGNASITAAGGTNLTVAAQAAATFYLVATNVSSGTEAFTLVRAAG
jgi:hypothetical protein